jgi:phosphate starvation-inducible PhoH-like protein
VVITGDASQKDLAPGAKSGLDVALRVLKNVDEIAVCELTSRDVVRHPLVQKIVNAYEDYEQSQERKEKKKAAKLRGKKS